MANNAQLVSLGKPKKGGAIFRAPFGTTLPTSADAVLDEAFVCLGYVNEDGLTNNNSASTDPIRAWGGDIVLLVDNEKEDTFALSLMESLNVDVLKAVYGDDNVSGTLDNGITIRANNTPAEASSWVIDMEMRNGTKKRIVIQNGIISELSEISYVDTEAVGYGVTINAMPGDSSFDYDTHKEYIKAA